MTNQLVLIPEMNKSYLLNNGKENHIKLRLSIHASEEMRRTINTADKKHLGTDLCIVLDSSFSMGETISGDYTETGKIVEKDGSRYKVIEKSHNAMTKLDVATSAIKSLIPTLRGNDTITLITYNDNPKVIFAGKNKTQKDEIINLIDNNIESKGNTNISAAIREARMLLDKCEDTRTKKIIFITDGYPEGDTEQNCIIEGELLADYKISIDCLGIGDDFNFSLMEKIVRPTKGRTDIINDLSDAERIFSTLFKNSQEVIATNAELKLSFSKSVRVKDHYRGTPENLYLGKVRLSDNSRDYKLNLGQIERNQRYDYYFDMTIPAQEDYKGPLRIIKAELLYYIPQIDNEVKKVEQKIHIECGDNKTLATRVNGDVERGYTLAEIKRIESYAKEAYEENRIIDSITEYEKIVKKYQALGAGKEMKEFQQLIVQLKTTNKIDRKTIIKTEHSSSKIVDSGQLGMTIDTTDIFGRRGGRRNKK